MGAQQSSEDGAGTAGQAIKICYYDLLGVRQDASDEEIKKAYRRKALEHHPDRNYDDAKNATRRFAEIQAAYDVLSDLHERAWYDSHRDAILNGRNSESSHSTTTTARFGMVRVTTVEDLMLLIRHFNGSVPMTDEPGGFFFVVGEMFSRLDGEETVAATSAGCEAPAYPRFGKHDDSWESVARQFYARWAGFYTQKSFAWVDKYKPSDAPDRRTRRLVEKENKRARDVAAREFNDTVRFVVSFVRKRDPRATNAVIKSEAERVKAMREATAAQAARSRAANQERLAELAGLQTALQAVHMSDGGDMEGEFSDSDESIETIRIECVVCRKTFKSEKQYEAHTKSKKHQKAVRGLRRDMRAENQNLDLGSPERAEEKSPIVDTVVESERNAEDHDGHD